MDPLAAWNLGPAATVADVKREWRARAKQAHPDQGGSTTAFRQLKSERDAAMQAVAERNAREQNRGQDRSRESAEAKRERTRKQRQHEREREAEQRRRAAAARAVQEKEAREQKEREQARADAARGATGARDRQQFQHSHWPSPNPTYAPKPWPRTVTYENRAYDLEWVGITRDGRRRTKLSSGLSELWLDTWLVPFEDMTPEFAEFVSKRRHPVQEEGRRPTFGTSWAAEEVAREQANYQRVVDEIARAKRERAAKIAAEEAQRKRVRHAREESKRRARATEAERIRQAAERAAETTRRRVAAETAERAVQAQRKAAARSAQARTALRCPFCRAAAPANVRCAQCSAGLHSDCWEENGRSCPSCRSPMPLVRSAVQQAGQSRRVVRVPKRQGFWQRLWGLLTG
jgi:colicin import membrane protein